MFNKCSNVYCVHAVHGVARFSVRVFHSDFWGRPVKDYWPKSFAAYLLTYKWFSCCVVKRSRRSVYSSVELRREIIKIRITFKLNTCSSKCEVSDL